MVTSDCYRSFAVPVVDTSGFLWLVVTTGGLSTHNYFGCGNPACTTQLNSGVLVYVVHAVGYLCGAVVSSL